MDGIDDVTEKATATTGDDDDDAHDASASRTSMGDVDGGDDAEPAPMTLKEANSLDLLMSAMFKFIHSTCYQDGEYQLSGQRIPAIRTAVVVFSVHTK